MARKFLGSLSVHVFIHDDLRLEADTLVMIPPSNAEAVSQVLEGIAKQLGEKAQRIQVVPAVPKFNGVIQ